MRWLARILLAVGLVFFAATDSRALEDTTCVTCHTNEEDEELRLPVTRWRKSVHSEHQVSCDACHGGDPHAEDADESMSEQAGFLENPSWREAAEFCGVCHEAIAEHFDAGRFGSAIAAGTRAASCLDCHMQDGHRIVGAGADDLRIGNSCRRCLPIEDAAGGRTRLAELAALESALLAGIARVERKGIVLADLVAEVELAHDRRVGVVHAFDAVQLARGDRETREILAGIAPVAAAFEEEADRRRRYGVAVLASLTVLLAALTLYQRSLG